eukprot:CAMPEP_0172647066 /NCGR_PEP_ID=MMETSP1068-20121228/240561_1 /TAXON_ID=35684 /ORGANISM="Pseudopedinella elastica, Strain CCMP716" /LENGTH=515 /DNA_ID=CAMNT_0013461339 /DNA_START=612 /DNA_END=2159 /DNA_ORIENTATION=-
MAKNVPFPRKLYDLIEVEPDWLIEWAPHGESFFIRDQDEFCTRVLAKYFRHTKLTSFQRQLNLYGFRRITKGPDTGAYSHPEFSRHHPEVLDGIKRVVRKGAAGVDGRYTPHHRSHKSTYGESPNSPYTFPDGSRGPVASAYPPHGGAAYAEDSEDDDDEEEEEVGSDEEYTPGGERRRGGRRNLYSKPYLTGRGGRGRGGRGEKPASAGIDVPKPAHRYGTRHQAPPESFDPYDGVGGSEYPGGFGYGGGGGSPVYSNSAPTRGRGSELLQSGGLASRQRSMSLGGDDDEPPRHAGSSGGSSLQDPYAAPPMSPPHMPRPRPAAGSPGGGPVRQMWGANPSWGSFGNLPPMGPQRSSSAMSAMSADLDSDAWTSGQFDLANLDDLDQFNFEHSFGMATFGNSCGGGAFSMDEDRMSSRTAPKPQAEAHTAQQTQSVAEAPSSVPSATLPEPLEANGSFFLNPAAVGNGASFSSPPLPPGSPRALAHLQPNASGGKGALLSAEGPACEPPLVHHA